MILIDVQYSQKVVFSFEKGLNCQTHFSGSLCSVNPLSPSKILITPPRPSPLGRMFPNPTPYCYLENPEFQCLKFRYTEVIQKKTFEFSWNTQLCLILWTCPLCFFIIFCSYLLHLLWLYKSLVYPPIF